MVLDDRPKFFKKIIKILLRMLDVFLGFNNKPNLGQSLSFVVLAAFALALPQAWAAPEVKSTRCEKAFDDNQDSEAILNVCRQDLMVPLKREQKLKVLETLGKVYSAQGEHELAAKTWLEASQYPVSGPSTRDGSLENWVKFQVLTGQAYVQANQPEKAEAVLTGALRRAESTLGAYSLPAGTAQDALGTHYALSNRPEKAVKAFERARIVHEIRLGKNHPKTIEVRLNQAIGLLDMNRENDAKKQLENLAAVIEPLPEFAGSPIKAEVLTFLGTLQMRDEQLKESISSYQTALNIRQKEFGQNDLRTSQSYNNLGVVLYRAGRFDDAIANLSKAYVIRKEKLGEQDSLTQSTQKNLQAVLAAQQDKKRR